MGGRGQPGSEESGAVYYPGLGKRRFGGQVPPGAFDFFAQSTARYGGGLGSRGGRMRLADIPREWLGDPRYAGFLSWLQEQGIVDPGVGPGAPEYEVSPLPEAPVPPPLGGGPEEAPPGGEPAPIPGPGPSEPSEGGPAAPAPGEGGGEPSPGPDAEGPAGPGPDGGNLPDAGGPGNFFGDVSPGVIPGEPGEGQESTRGGDYSELTPEEKEALEKEKESKSEYFQTS